MKAELCPVCMGRSKVRHLPDRNSTSLAPNEKTCHGCGGQGWVYVYEEQYHIPNIHQVYPNTTDYPFPYSKWYCYYTT